MEAMIWRLSDDEDKSGYTGQTSGHGAACTLASLLGYSRSYSFIRFDSREDNFSNIIQQHYYIGNSTSHAHRPIIPSSWLKMATSFSWTEHGGRLQQKIYISNPFMSAIAESTSSLLHPLRALLATSLALDLNPMT